MGDKKSYMCNKRKDADDDDDMCHGDPGSLKKAKYSWQIKGLSNIKPTDKETELADPVTIETVNETEQTDCLSTDRGTTFQNSDDVCFTLDEHNSIGTKPCSCIGGCGEDIGQVEDVGQGQASCEKLTSNTCIKDDISKGKLCEHEILNKCVRCEKCSKCVHESHISDTQSLVHSSSTNDGIDVQPDLHQKDLSVHLNELEKANQEMTTGFSSYSSQPHSNHGNMPASHSSGQRTDDYLNLSDSETEEEGLLFSSPQRCTNSLDFDLHLARWQNQHAAKAIVDNAINKTLEEMGVSPEEDPDVDDFTADKCYVEDEGISEAIRRQGLICQSDARESHFTESLPAMSWQQNSGDDLDEFQRQLHVLENERLSLGLIHSSSSSSSLSKQQVGSVEVYQDSSSLSTSTSSHSSIENTCQNRDKENITTIYQTDNHVPISSSELLDHAVSIAICSQGLAVQNNLF